MSNRKFYWCGPGPSPRDLANNNECHAATVYQRVR